MHAASMHVGKSLAARRAAGSRPYRQVGEGDPTSLVNSLWCEPCASLTWRSSIEAFSCQFAVANRVRF